MRTITAILILLCAAAQAEVPVAGPAVAQWQPVDAVVLKFMDRLDAKAAAVAIGAGDGKPVQYSRGFGWRNQEKQKPTPPDLMFRIASVSKPFTAAVIHDLIRERRLALDTRIWDVLDIRPKAGEPADARWKDITIGQLLEHKGGFDRSQAPDPMFRMDLVQKEFALKRPPTAAEVVACNMGLPLQFAPGEKSVYSNFGYCVLGRVIEKVTGKSYYDNVAARVCKPWGITGIALGQSKPGEHEVSYPIREDAFLIEVMDAHGGLVASAPALCEFLQHYWISGLPRKPGAKGYTYTFFGSLPGTTSMVRQRPDGVNCAVLFNGRRDRSIDEDTKALLTEMDAAIDAIMKPRTAKP
ncbi:MAG: serine hydrolase domain-containing protein [Tepidisphaeraceae bacterium]|jgi:CubicO group peptidase (beta-lactamase class C family)